MYSQTVENIKYFFHSLDYRDGLLDRERVVTPFNPNAAPPVDRTAPAPSNNAERVARTWSDPTVAAARGTRSGVRVTYDGGKNISEHRSTKAAFIALDLPIPEHQKFRALLKASKAKHFAFEGVHYLFEIIDEPSND